MSMHPAIAAALSEQHRRDLTARAETHRITHAARDSHPAPVRPMRTILLPIAAVRRAVMRQQLKTPAATGAGSES
jgi:hypothetical protein